MKAKVMRSYIDKDTKKAYKVGDSVELENGRFEELKTNGFVAEDLTMRESEIKALRKENTTLKAKVAELTAVREKAAGAQGTPGK
jgi:hypothetical protein